MAQYIDKSALVAEIENIRKHYIERDDFDYGWNFALDKVLSFLDTIEVIEVDLEKEIENILEKEKAFVTDNREVKYYNGDSFNHIYELEFIAKHFFELGLKVAQKGE